MNRRECLRALFGTIGGLFCGYAPSFAYSRPYTDFDEASAKPGERQDWAEYVHAWLDGTKCNGCVAANAKEGWVELSTFSRPYTESGIQRKYGSVQILFTSIDRKKEFLKMRYQKRFGR